MQEKNLTSVQSRLRSLADAAKLKNADLARIAGVSGVAAGKWFASDQIPKAEQLLKLARHFGVSMEWLLTGRGLRALPTSGRDLLVSRTARQVTASDLSKKMGISVLDYTAIEQGITPFPEEGDFVARFLDALLIAADDAAEKTSNLPSPAPSYNESLASRTVEIAACASLAAGDEMSALELVKAFVIGYEKNKSAELASLFHAKSVLELIIRARIGVPMKLQLLTIISETKHRFLEAGGSMEAWQDHLEQSIRELRSKIDPAAEAFVRDALKAITSV